MSFKESSDSFPLANPILPPPLKSIRFELLSSAINFLKDPQVQSAPLSKRLAFLEGKGLTSEEIDLAIIRSTDAINFDLKNENDSITTDIKNKKNHQTTMNSNSNIKSFLLTTAIIIGASSLIISNYDYIKSYTSKICEKLGITISKSDPSSAELDELIDSEKIEKSEIEIKRIEWELKESIQELKNLMEEREQALINRITNMNESKTKDQNGSDSYE